MSDAPPPSDETGAPATSGAEVQKAETKLEKEARRKEAALVDAKRYGDVVFGAPLNRPSEAFRRTAKLLVGTAARGFFRIKVINAERLPMDGPLILAPSHRSNLDTPIVGAAIPRWMRFMAKDSIFKSRFWTQFIVSLGGFPVRRGTLDRRTLDNAMEILGRGEGIVIFPEGARQEGPRIRPIFEGAVWISSRANAPILPVGIGGSHAAQPIGKKMIRPARVHLVLGELMYPPTPLEGKKRVSRTQMEQFSSDLREALQVVFDEANASAGTPNGPWSDEDEAERRQPWEK